MERCGYNPGRVEGAASPRVSQLSVLCMGSEGSRRSDCPRWSPLEKSSRMILAGDVGGTSVRLAYFEVKNGRLAAVAEEVKQAREYPSLEAAVVEFIGDHHCAPICACFGVAGPVTNRI